MHTKIDKLHPDTEQILMLITQIFVLGLGVIYLFTNRTHNHDEYICIFTGKLVTYNQNSSDAIDLHTLVDEQRGSCSTLRQILAQVLVQ